MKPVIPTFTNFVIESHDRSSGHRRLQELGLDKYAGMDFHEKLADSIDAFSEDPIVNQSIDALKKRLEEITADRFPEGIWEDPEYDSWINQYFDQTPIDEIGWFEYTLISG